MDDSAIPTGAIELARQADFQLGAMTVSPSSREAVRGDWREVLEPRVMQVLVALHEAGGAVVSRDDLIARCWEGRVVGDDAMHRAIGRLRRLSEADDGASFQIDTIARVGYRLRTNGAIAAEPGHAPAPRPHHAWRYVSGGAVAVLLAAAVWWLRQPPDFSVDSFKIVVSTPLLENDPAIAPNGEMLAYSAGPAPYIAHIFVRNLSDGQPIQLTDGVGDNDIHPAWAPAGDRVAFIRHREGEPCAIVIKPVPAGDERIIGRCKLDDFATLAWSPRGDVLYFHDRLNQSSPRQIVKLELASGKITAVSHPPPGVNGDQRPQISPDGRKMAFFRNVKGGATRLVQDLETGQTTELNALHGYGEDEAWLDNETLLVSGGGMAGAKLWLYPLNGKPRQLLVNPLPLGQIARGPQGFFATEIGQARMLLATPPEQDGGKPVVLQDSNGVTMFPDYSVDGRLAYSHVGPGGHWEIWLQPPGQTPRQLTAMAANYLLGLTWSPDGSKLAFYAGIGDKRGLYVLNADGTGLTLVKPLVSAGTPAWSADGRTLLYPAKDEGGWRLWRVALAAPDQAPPISDYGWFSVRTSGNAIYGFGTRESGVWRLDGKPRFITNLQRRCTDAFLECMSWFVKGDTLVFADYSDRAHPRLVQHDVTTGNRRIVATPGLSYSDLATLDPISGKLTYVYDGASDSDIALFHVDRK